MVYAKKWNMLYVTVSLIISHIDNALVWTIKTFLPLSQNILFVQAKMYMCLALDTSVTHCPINCFTSCVVFDILQHHYVDPSDIPNHTKSQKFEKVPAFCNNVINENLVNSPDLKLFHECVTFILSAAN